MSFEPPPPPLYQPPPPPPVDTAAAASRVKGPAITLIVITAIGIVLQLISMAMNMVGMRSTPAGLPPEFERWIEMSAGPLGLLAGLLTLAVGGLIIFGAMKMMRLESHGLAMAASIVAMIPCLSPCCCLGLPVGIWSLVVLNNAQVKAAFR